MSEGFCILSKIKKDEKEDELLAVDLENIKRVENLEIETEKLPRGLNIMNSFQYNLSKYTSNIRKRNRETFKRTEDHGQLSI